MTRRKARRLRTKWNHQRRRYPRGKRLYPRWESTETRNRLEQLARGAIPAELEAVLVELSAEAQKLGLGY